MTKVKREKSFAAHWISFKCKETFCSFSFICIENAVSIRMENLHKLSKIHESHEAFLLHSFCCLWYLISPIRTPISTYQLITLILGFAYKDLMQ